MVMVFNATLLVEKPTNLLYFTDKLLSHNVVSSTPHQLSYDHHDDGARNECKHRDDAHY